MWQFDEDDEEGSVVDQDSYNVANMSSVRSFLIIN